MPTYIQKSFSGGEISPSLYARTDISKYATGLRTCRNFFIQKHGGARNRPGTQFVAEVKDSSKAVRLIPFVFNDDQTYVLEFGDEYIRFHSSGSPVRESSVSITSITKADPAVVTANSHGYSNGDYVYISGVVEMPEINNRTFIVSNKTTNTFELHDIDGNDVDSSGYTAVGASGSVSRVYEISSPYDVDDLLDLKFAQSADVLTITHPSYQPRELARSGNTNWTISTTSGAGSEVESPSEKDPAIGTAGSETLRYRVTAINKVTGEESESTEIVQSGVAAPTESTPVYVAWNYYDTSSVSNSDFWFDPSDIEFNLYKYDEDAARFGLLNIVDNVANHVSNPVLLEPDSVQYVDRGVLDIDLEVGLPSERDEIFVSSDEYPSVVSYIQQRKMFANTNTNPETIWASRIGSYSNFRTFRSPIQDNDPLQFTLAGNKVNAVKHILNLSKPVVMTQAGSWVLNGNEAQALTPFEIYPKQHSYRSVSDLRPLIIDDSAIYLDGRKTLVRDLAYNFEVDGYRGNDLTIFSSHLFDGKTVVDWDYAENPNSIVWGALSDGSVVALTYIKEQQMLAWHRHDFEGGSAERVCSVPEGREDGVYFVVKRTINGSTRRFIERFRDRYFSDIKDAVFMDASFTYDGRNTGSTTMTLSGGTDWTFDETLTLTASSSYFTSGDVGNKIVLTDSSGDPLRCEIKSYTSATVVSVRAHKTVPSDLRSSATTNWSEAVDEIAGLWDLEGEEVVVFGDGYVVASPNNDSYSTLTVSGGKIELSDNYSVVHVGLPYVCDLQTLDVELASDGTLIDLEKSVTAVNLFVQESRGIWVGSSEPESTTDLLEGLEELKIRENEDYDDPVRLITDKVTVQIPAEWNSNGRVFIRQVDPLPLSILAVAPSGTISEEGI